MSCNSEIRFEPVSRPLCLWRESLECQRDTKGHLGGFFFFKELESKKPNWGLVKTFAGTAHATKCFSSVLVRITIEWCFDDPVNAFFSFQSSIVKLNIRLS